MHDIAGRDDIELLLRDFYSRALQDPLLRQVFVDVAHMDLEAHLPQITDFWQKVLLDTGTYSGRVMEVHRRIHERIPLTGAHFGRWLVLWRDSVADNHSGPVAEQAVTHAERMTSVFLRNLTEPVQVLRPLPIVQTGSSA